MKTRPDGVRMRSRERPSVWILIVLVSGLAVMSRGCSEASEPPGSEVPADALQYVTPEDVGYSSQKLDEAKQFAVQSGYAAVMAASETNVFFSWGDVSRNFLTHSIRKPLLSALYGIHVEGGAIDLDQTLAELGIDDIPPHLTSEEQQASVRELLQSRSGVYHEAAAEDSTMIAQRPLRGSHPHGTFFYYNNWDFNAAGTVFRQRTGLDIFEAFQKEIAEPVGMQEFSPSNCAYQLESSKSQHPAYSFRMSARDMLRFGVLFQQGGRWQGRQIIPQAWIAQSTASYSTLDSASGIGYGFMWRTIPATSSLAQSLGSWGYYHTGVGVHALIVLPDLHLVIVERVNTDGATWVDPGEAGLQLGMMIINARL